MSRRYVVLGVPRSGKNSGRVIWRKKWGVSRRYRVPSAAAGRWTESAREAYRKAGPLQLLQGRLSIDIQVFQPNELPDGDNVQNLVWDSLKGIVVNDDAQFVQWSGAKHVGVQPARVEITITSLEA